MKKIIIYFLVCGLVLFASSQSYTRNTSTPGDINGDGFINLSDAVLTLQVLVSHETQYNINLNAEVNNDTKIGLEEAVYILQKLCVLYPASCIDNLNNWKLNYLPRNSDCTKCHTTCTPAHSFFCEEGKSWGESGNSCLNCHGSIHGYVVFAWNDLGMHCLNSTYDKAVILPPYNTIQGQVIKKARYPKIITNGITVEYAIQNNTYSYGKQDYGQFWDNAKQLFGIDLEQDKGMNLEDPDIHNGLSGFMTAKNGRFEAQGIPVTPVNDDLTWDPYQIGEITVRDSSGSVLAQTKATVPVSDEINCSKCHGAFTNILQKHDKENNTSLLSQAPVLCADCHGSPALGRTTAGSSGKYLSEAIHDEHAEEAASCYDCHPGQTSKCNRSIAHTGSDGNCINCHGTMEQVADSIEEGQRIPWINEPKCVTCHTGIPGVDTGDTLYRNAKGHGGLYCTVCHGSPHAMVPSSEETDNYQAVQYQNKAKTIGSCGACHRKSKVGEISEFQGEHGGLNPEVPTSCHICHISVSSETAKWPHEYQWKTRYR
ncbi:MAG: hypothetical protein GY795_43975 [Desulfobacterales bacterium]|nr:hypothetical protein [Desulfobacterales bacterium]